MEKFVVKTLVVSLTEKKSSHLPVKLIQLQMLQIHVEFSLFVCCSK